MAGKCSSRSGNLSRIWRAEIARSRRLAVGLARSDGGVSNARPQAAAGRRATMRAWRERGSWWRKARMLQTSPPLSGCPGAALFCEFQARIADYRRVARYTHRRFNDALLGSERIQEADAYLRSC